MNSADFAVMWGAIINLNFVIIIISGIIALIAVAALIFGIMSYRKNKIILKELQTLKKKGETDQ